MTCSDVNEALGEYVEGALAPEARRAVDAHLHECPACAQLAADLGRVRQLAASLDRLQPPPAAWTRIAREAQLPGYGAERARRGWQGWIPLAAAAAIVLTLAVTWMMKTRTTTPPQSASTSAPQLTGGPALQTVASELQLAEQHYEKAIAGLEQLANDRKVLDPVVAGKLQKNFEIIDGAISESRAALKADPTSEPAQQSLFEAFRAKITLLQDTVALINEMRKGNPEGTARVAEGMHKS
jgi:hypothetical protein